VWLYATAKALPSHYTGADYTSAGYLRLAPYDRLPSAGSGHRRAAQSIAAQANPRQPAERHLFGFPVRFKVVMLQNY